MATITIIDDPFPTPLIGDDEQEAPRDGDALTDEEREWLDGLIDTYKHTTVYDAIVVCPCP